MKQTDKNDTPKSVADTFSNFSTQKMAMPANPSPEQAHDMQIIDKYNNEFDPKTTGDKKNTDKEIQPNVGH